MIYLKQCGLWKSNPDLYTKVTKEAFEIYASNKRKDSLGQQQIGW